ncbi:unnamed protein product [Aureobasidium mustum]|uniref:Uncharacterized protein n=1 Tax=Aureobasidium mustum TaxID=2773714 RepID=A0A9N8PFS1_9PEZI|nr:unnamed protein product [Aureobasidium mustum]
MTPPIAEILKDSEYKPELVQRIAFRTSQPNLEVVPYDPTWPSVFTSIKTRILTALGSTALAVHHTGSTSIPNLPAKNIIDIDLVVKDSTDEDAYVSRLEAAGFKFLLREPHWHQHRFFYTYEPCAVNLHVWSPESPEVVRHQIFRQQLLDCPEDMAMYLRAKELAASQIKENGGLMQDYNLLKEDTIRQILRNAFKDLGYIT